jgi:hypothetical protein
MCSPRGGGGGGSQASSSTAVHKRKRKRKRKKGSLIYDMAAIKKREKWWGGVGSTELKDKWLSPILSHMYTSLPPPPL